MLGIVPAVGQRGQRLEVVGDAGLIPGLGRQDQPFIELSGGFGQVAPGLTGKRQVIERDEDGEPVGRAAGGGEAVGEQPQRGVVIPVAQPDLAQEVVDQGEVQPVQQALPPVEPIGVLLPQLAEGLLEQFTGACAVAARAQEPAQRRRDQARAQRVPGLTVKRQAFLQQRARRGLVPVGQEGEAGTAQGLGPLDADPWPSLLATIFSSVRRELVGVPAQPPEPPCHPDQLHRPGQSGPGIHQPGQCGAEVVVVGPPGAPPRPAAPGRPARPRLARRGPGSRRRAGRARRPSHRSRAAGPGRTP